MIMNRSILLLCGITGLLSAVTFFPSINTFETREFYNNLMATSDTVITPSPDEVQSLNSKVIIGSDDNTLEITPQSTFNNGVLIEPVNPVSGTGLNTAFLLRDSSAWEFYTNSQRRLTIQGNGDIRTSSSLLMGAPQDSFSLLRVNGNIRIDSSLYLWPSDDPEAIISLNRKVRNGFQFPDDSIAPFTTTPTAWAFNNDIPALRIRHPRNVAGNTDLRKSFARDFLILPYEFGMAIEFNGVVECWVGEWSIHKGVNYSDPEGQGNGWGGVSWVGDDIDAGGIRTTARNNTSLGGNVAYGEMSVEKFNAQPNGDLRLRLPSTENNFHFVYGGRGSTDIIAKMKNEGLVIPKMSSTGNITNPETAQIVFDSTESRFKGYNGTAWVNFNEEEKLVTGSFGNGGNGADTVYAIPHGLGVIPVYYQVTATSRDAGNISYVTADVNFLNVYYSVPPPAGINNLTWNWQVKK